MRRHWGSCIGARFLFAALALPRPVRVLQNAFADDDKEKRRGEAEHQNACESLDRTEHSPFFGQDEIAVADGSIRNRRKVE